MSTATTIDIAEIIDGQRWPGFLARFLILLALMAVFDGYDFGCMAFAAQPSSANDTSIRRRLV